MNKGLNPLLGQCIESIQTSTYESDVSRSSHFCASKREFRCIVPWSFLHPYLWYHLQNRSSVMTLNQVMILTTRVSLGGLCDSVNGNETEKLGYLAVISSNVAKGSISYKILLCFHLINFRAHKRKFFFLIASLIFNTVSFCFS